jgi:hypothetical protein
MRKWRPSGFEALLEAGVEPVSGQRSRVSAPASGNAGTAGRHRGIRETNSREYGRTTDNAVNMLLLLVCRSCSPCAHIEAVLRHETSAADEGRMTRNKPHCVEDSCASNGKW